MATVVFVHAHPDDEAILTAGTMRALIESGHRVVLALATDGAAGLTDDFHSQQLGQRRLAESQAAADAIGLHRREWLGFADSGLDSAATSHLESLCSADVEDAAQRLVRLLDEENADVVIGYDAQGGYGHPDHVRVHQLVHRAAELHGTVHVFEATLDRKRINQVIGWSHPLGRLFNISAINNLRHGFSASDDIHIDIDVTGHREIKKASMRAHASQTVGGGLPRSLRLFLALPNSLFDFILGREHFIQTRGHNNNPLAELNSAVVRGRNN